MPHEKKLWLLVPSLLNTAIRNIFFIIALFNQCPKVTTVSGKLTNSNVRLCQQTFSSRLGSKYLSFFLFIYLTLLNKHNFLPKNITVTCQTDSYKSLKYKPKQKECSFFFVFIICLYFYISINYLIHSK